MAPTKKSAKEAELRKGSKKAPLQGRGKTKIVKKRRLTQKGAFWRFEKLPLEVRCMIWKYALPAGSRNIGIQLTSHPTRWTKKLLQDVILGTPKPWDIHLVAPPPPALLFVNKEARDETRRFYESVAGPQWPVGHPWHSLSGKPQGYVKWETDRVCLLNSFNFYKETPSVTEAFMHFLKSKNVKHVAVECSFGFDYLEPLLGIGRTVEKVDLYFDQSSYELVNTKNGLSLSAYQKKNFLDTQYFGNSAISDGSLMDVGLTKKDLEEGLKQLVKKKRHQRLLGMVEEWENADVEVEGQDTPANRSPGKSLEVNLVMGRATKQ